jgi:hypothetical protein
MRDGFVTTRDDDADGSNSRVLEGLGLFNTPKCKINPATERAIHHVTVQPSAKINIGSCQHLKISQNSDHRHQQQIKLQAFFHTRKD